MSSKLITAPSVLPVTLALAKLQCREDGTAQDDLITLYINAAREACEHELQRALAPQTWEVTYHAFPTDIVLAYPPLITVDSVKYYDTDEVLQTLDPSAYSVESDSEPGWIVPALDTDWPSTAAVANAVRVRFQCGYADGLCPENIQAWLLLAVAESFAQREHSTDKPRITTPFVARLLDRYKVY